MGEFEVNDVDLDEFAKQFKEECLENGVVLTVCVPSHNIRTHGKTFTKRPINEIDGIYIKRFHNDRPDI